MDSDKDQETSESGAPIYRYPAKEQSWSPANMEDSSLDAIDKHIAAHVGKVSMVFHEIVSNLVHIDVHQIPPTEERPYWTLVTSGMSDVPMKTPAEATDFAHVELMICLPRTWKMQQADWKEEAN